MCVRARARSRETEVFLNDLVNCQNYILWWRKWKNEIRARALGGMTVMEHCKSSDTLLWLLFLPTQIPHVLARVPACTRRMVGIAGSLLPSAAGVGSGLADGRILFHFIRTACRASITVLGAN